jgi:hypothetical protein
MKQVPYDRIREILTYNPHNGSFIWNVRNDARQEWNTRYAGKPAGSLHNGYLIISIDNTRFPAHRIAWVYMTGINPQNVIDHIDRNPKNNKFSNLRLASVAENRMNVSSYSNSKSGIKGVSYCQTNRKWRTEIQANYKKTCLGWFESKELAEEAYKNASLKIHGQFSPFLAANAAARRETKTEGARQ